MKKSKKKSRINGTKHSAAFEKKVAYQKSRFLESFSVFPHQGMACQFAGICAETVYKWRDEDKPFEKAYNVAKSRRFDLAEDEAFRRAVKGYAGRPVLYKGKIKVRIQEYSDTMLGRLLAAHDKRYRAKPTDEQGGDVHHIPIEVNFNVAAPAPSNERGTPSQAPR